MFDTDRNFSGNAVHMSTLERIKDQRVIAILRGYSTERSVEIVEQLLAGGVRTVEITMDSPDAPGTIEALHQAFDEVLVGAGTVRTTEDAEGASGAGAQFALSPVFETDVVQACKEKGMVMLPGCVTPTEMMNAYNLGADGIKLFPAANFGPSYLKRVKTPLPDMLFVPTGGVSSNNAGEYMEAGASAVGAGSFLTGGIEEDGLTSVRDRAATLREAVRDV